MDLRTQRITLDVSYDADLTDDPAHWDWNRMIADGNPNESASVVSAERSLAQRPQHPVGGRS